MKAWPCGVVTAILLAGVARGVADKPLPAWNDGERGGVVAGAWLFDEQAPATAAEPLDIRPPTAEDLAVPANSTSELPEKFRMAYFGERPQTFLVDPQGLLSAADHRSRLKFLQDHAADSALDLYIYIFKGEQEIPSELRAEELSERFFATGRPAVIVYYYMGSPQRAVMLLSPSLTDVVSATEQHRALESSVMQAAKKTDAASQLEVFMVQLSIRIYWMERLMGGGTAAREGSPVIVRKPPETSKTAAIMGKLQPLLDGSKRFTLPAAVVGGALVMALLMNAWVKRRARYRFPEFDIEPRLGGIHAAGVGAVISFASAAVSPNTQREQVSDSPHRR